LARFGRVLDLESCDIGADLGIVPVMLEKILYPSPREAKQRCVDEFDGRRRPLDVQEDGARLRQLDAVRTGMYVGPMQSG
jgi:hypothetical protein